MIILKELKADIIKMRFELPVKLPDKNFSLDQGLILGIYSKSSKIKQN